MTPKPPSSTASPHYDLLIIGAGIAGLAAGRMAHQSGQKVMLIDKGQRVGGRVSTRRDDGFIFNHGAQFASSKSSDFGNILRAASTAGMAANWQIEDTKMVVIGKPMMRVHTAGSVGGSTAVVATHAIEAGRYRRVLTLAFQKQSESNAMWALSPAYPFVPPTVAGAGGYFAPLIRAYIRRSGAPEDIGWRVTVKDRENAMRNPLAHLHQPVTLEQVSQAPILWDPINYLETCPSSDGACAMVLCAEDLAQAAPRPPAWVHATSVRTEPIIFSGRDQVNPEAGKYCAADLYAQAKITGGRLLVHPQGPLPVAKDAMAGAAIGSINILSTVESRPIDHHSA